MPPLLLIEDESTLAKNIALYLTRYGWEVDIANTAEDALLRVEVVAPDIALLDFNLPGMDGLAALSKLRARDPQLRVVMMTGHANVQLAVDAMKAALVAAGVEVRMSKAGVELLPGPGFDAARLEGRL